MVDRLTASKKRAAEVLSDVVGNLPKSSSKETEDVLDYLDDVAQKEETRKRTKDPGSALLRGIKHLLRGA